MFQIDEIIETNRMIEEATLDVRTITMGISLLDCIDPDPQAFIQKCQAKIKRLAGRLVPVAKQLEKELGVPIVHQRLAVTPVALCTPGYSEDDLVRVAIGLDQAAAAVGVNYLGGYSALVQGGMTVSDERLIRTMPKALAQTERLCASVQAATTRQGMNMDAVRLMGEVILEAAKQTPKLAINSAARIVVFANAPEDNPFMAGAFFGVSYGEAAIHVGVSGPGVVHDVLKHAQADDFEQLAERIKKTAFKITRVGQLVAKLASERLNIPLGIVDLSLAPTPAIGDSIARILEDMGLEKAGAPGTTAALAMLNDAVKKGGVMAASSVGGLSGAFIPVSEDEGMVDAVVSGALNLEKLEAMTSVCSVGLDMVVLPGDVAATTLSGIIADELAIGMINQKTTAARLIPAIGKQPGEWLEFGGLFGGAPVMDVSRFDSTAFIQRGGRMPAPLHSFRN